MNPDRDTAEVEYREMRQQVAEQSSELERIDRKATALMTPLGVLIGLGINAKPSDPHLSLRDGPLYLGLLLLAVALLFGIRAIWPKGFSRVAPEGLGRRRSGQVTVHTRGDRTWPRTAVRRLASRLFAISETPVEKRRARHEPLFFETGWAKENATATLVALTEEWAAAWRANTDLTTSKVNKLKWQFRLMLLGTISLLVWYALKATA